MFPKREVSEEGEVDEDNEEELGDAKLILLIRSDLKMEKGKISAQASHAVLKAVRANARFAKEQWKK